MNNLIQDIFTFFLRLIFVLTFLYLYINIHKFEINISDFLLQYQIVASLIAKINIINQ